MEGIVCQNIDGYLESGNEIEETTRKEKVSGTHVCDQIRHGVEMFHTEWREMTSKRSSGEEQEIWNKER